MSTKRKTHTSCEVKNRWNRAHYDVIRINAPKGSAEELRAVAAERGMSVSAYIRSLVIRDTAENPDSTRILRGGAL